MGPSPVRATYSESFAGCVVHRPARPRNGCSPAPARYGTARRWQRGIKTAAPARGASGTDITAQMVRWDAALRRKARPCKIRLTSTVPMSLAQVTVIAADFHPVPCPLRSGAARAIWRYARCGWRFTPAPRRCKDFAQALRPRRVIPAFNLHDGRRRYRQAAILIPVHINSSLFYFIWSGGSNNSVRFAAMVGRQRHSSALSVSAFSKRNKGLLRCGRPQSSVCLVGSGI